MNMKKIRSYEDQTFIDRQVTRAFSVVRNPFATDVERKERLRHVIEETFDHSTCPHRFRLLCVVAGGYGILIGAVIARLFLS